MGSFTVLHRDVKYYHFIKQPIITLCRNIFIQNSTMEKQGMGNRTGTGMEMGTRMGTGNCVGLVPTLS